VLFTTTGISKDNIANGMALMTATNIGFKKISFVMRAGVIFCSRPRGTANER